MSKMILNGNVFSTVQLPKNQTKNEKVIKEITIDFASTQVTNLIGSSNKNSVVETWSKAERAK